MSALSAKFFHDEAAAFEKLESLLWAGRPRVPSLWRHGSDHCG